MPLLIWLAAISAAASVFWVQRGYLHRSKIRINIGLNRFPDSIPLLYAAQRGFLASFDVHFHFLNWAVAYDYLLNGTVDTLFGVRRISASLIADFRSNLHDGRNLTLYQGYALILSPGSSLLSYVENSNAAERLNPRTQGSIVKQTLRQLEGREVRVMSWDTKDSTERLLAYADVAAKVTVSRNLEEDFTSFVSGNSNVGAFVGGITQRLIARRNNCKELISEQHIGLGLIERTGLVYQEIPDSIVRSIEEAWFKAVSEINTDRAAKSSYLSLLNKYCRPEGLLNFEFTLDDLSVFWNKWEKFAGSESETRDLRAPDAQIELPTTVSVEADYWADDNVVPIRQDARVSGKTR